LLDWCVRACVETSPPFGLLHRGEACHGPIYIYTRARVGSTCLPLGALGWAVRTELLRLGIPGLAWPGGRRKGMAYWHVRAVGTNGIRDSSVVFLPYLTPCWHASKEGDGHAETAAVAAAVATQYASPFSVSIPWPATARPFLPTPFFFVAVAVVEDNGRTRFQPLHYTPIRSENNFPCFQSGGSAEH
jgi:hypothetical protein